MIPRHFKQFLAVALMLIGLVVASQSLYAQCVTPPSGMVDWWPLDEAVGSTANDIAGSFNNSGTWMNSPTPVSGKVAGALCFDGVNDYVQVLTHSEVNFGTGDLTIDAWVKRDVASTQSPPSVIVDKRDISGIGYSLSVSWGRLVFTMCTTNYVTTTSPVPADGLWHFVAVTVDRVTNVGQFYCDGSPLDTFTPSCNLTNDFDLKIGEGYLGSNQRWRGCIDELEFFNRVLTPLEVHDIWAADSAGKCRGGVGGFKYWDLDRDGTHDLGEPGLQYWTIEAYAPGQSVRSNWSVTDAAGSYYMTLGTNYTNPATYYIREVPQSGWTQTLPLTAGEWVTVMPNVTYLGPDFLNYYQDSTERTSQTYLAGTHDNFVGPEASSPGQSLPSSPGQSFHDFLVNNASPCAVLEQFDVPSDDDWFGHTFDNLWDSTYLEVDARLCLRITATDWLSTTDVLYLGDWGNGLPGGQVWGIQLSALVNNLSTTVTNQPRDNSWDQGDTMTVCLDLDNLPVWSNYPTNIMATLQDGDLDVWIIDDTEVDWLELTVTFCCDSCDVDSLVIGTGMHPKWGWLAVGTKDPDWIVGSAPVPHLTGPATIVNPYYIPQSYWLTLNQSSWVTAKVEPINPLPASTAAGDYIYQYCFCADTLDHPRLTMKARTDNNATIFLNSTPVFTTPYTSFMVPPEPPPYPYGVSYWSAGFVTGGNVITAKVHNVGLVEGLDVQGYVTADDFSFSLTTAECCSCFTAADINGDGHPLQIGDLVYLIAFLHSAGPAPIPLYRGDLNGDCVVDTLDVQKFSEYFLVGMSAFPTYPIRTCCCVTAALITYPSPYPCGDANGSGTVNISDAVYLIAYIFSGGPAPSPLLAGDANCSGTVNISDAVYLIAYIFSGGPVPCAGCK